MGLRRGDIYTAAMGGGYGSKPRPVLVVQADALGTPKRVVALIGSPHDDVAPVRVRVHPNPANGLRTQSDVMVDLLQTVKGTQFGIYVGRLDDADMRRVDAALMLVLGIGLTA